MDDLKEHNDFWITRFTKELDNRKFKFMLGVGIDENDRALVVGDKQIPRETTISMAKQLLRIFEEGMPW